MSVSECYTLEIAALLHDIGKIGVPDAILLKPGPLTKEEWEIMGVHDHMGVEIVDSAFNSPELTEIIQSHHAFYGGKSRHASLPTGKDIPLGARILAIADTYDAIVSDRVYRKGRSPAEAFAELRRCAETQFDPDIVEQFIETIQQTSLASGSERSEVDKKTALRIGTQIERLSQAIDNNDRDALQALLGRLKMTARACDVQDIAEAVADLEEVVGDSAETSELLTLTNDLLSLCRSTQRVFLDRQTSAAPRNGNTNLTQSKFLRCFVPSATIDRVLRNDRLNAVATNGKASGLSWREGMRQERLCPPTTTVFHHADVETDVAERVSCLAIARPSW